MQSQTVLVGGLGGVQIADVGNVLVGVAEVVVARGCAGGVFDALSMPNGFASSNGS